MWNCSSISNHQPPMFGESKKVILLQKTFYGSNKFSQEIMVLATIIGKVFLTNLLLPARIISSSLWSKCIDLTNAMFIQGLTPSHQNNIVENSRKQNNLKKETFHKKIKSRPSLNCNLLDQRLENESIKDINKTYF